jgi:hypothetical protein
VIRRPRAAIGGLVVAVAATAASAGSTLVNAAASRAVSPAATPAATPAVSRAASAAPCSGDYAHGPYRSARLRFGIDPEPAGSAGAEQGAATPVNQAKTLAAVRALRPPGKQLVLRVNRLFESAGAAGIRRFRRIIAGYSRAGFDAELQVRYHPSPAEAGNTGSWTRYVRHVVDVFGSNRHVVAMTITNEINLAVSPNTSDGAYPRAEQALIRGIIAAHREAQRRGFTQLRFGFTFAYRFDPVTDAAVFSGLRSGGRAFRDALGFVGVDYYPELYPGLTTPLPAATLQMMATMRRCFMGLGGLGPRVPIWITESGYDTTPGKITLAQQSGALVQIVDTVSSAARTYGVTDYRWFNLRDNLSSTPAFAETSGLLTDTYHRKPSFSAYRHLIARFGAGRR